MDNITQGNIFAITLENLKLNIKYEQESHVCIIVNFFFSYIDFILKGRKDDTKKVEENKLNSRKGNVK